MDQHNAQRNLLFGILALKLGCIDRDALVAGFRAWIARPDRPLAQVLCDRGALPGGKRLLIAEALEEYLAAHGDDPALGLVAVQAPVGLRAALGPIADPGLLAALALLNESPTAPDATIADPALAPLSASSDPAATIASVPDPTADAFATQYSPTLPSARPPAPTMPDGPAATIPADPDPFATRPIEAAPSTVFSPTAVRTPETVTAVGSPSGVQAWVPASSPVDGSDRSFRMRYRTIRPHAKGGLGEVFVALDEELGREVALKEIQGKYADRTESRSRSLLEAEVTGGLEHPGIVPVYGLGQYPDGRPYYAMRFIRGQTFLDAINAFHQTDHAPRDPGRRALELRQLLNRFIDVCDAIGYAHARGILHRDIKPANVMLGTFGETLVVDWGLAKALDRPEPEGESDLKQLRPLSGGGNSETLFGSTIGTPHYMSPEQAAGRLDLLGPASDIYSLGATLYCLLAGRTPFKEPQLPLLLEKVRQGDFPSPRGSTTPSPRP